MLCHHFPSPDGIIFLSKGIDDAPSNPFHGPLLVSVMTVGLSPRMGLSTICPRYLPSQEHRLAMEILPRQACFHTVSQRRWRRATEQLPSCSHWNLGVTPSVMSGQPGQDKDIRSLWTQLHPPMRGLLQRANYALIVAYKYSLSKHNLNASGYLPMQWSPATH